MVDDTYFNGMYSGRKQSAKETVVDVFALIVLLVVIVVGVMQYGGII